MRRNRRNPNEPDSTMIDGPYEPYEEWDPDLQLTLRTETYTFPGFGMSVTCTYYGNDDDPTVCHREHR